MAPMIDEAIEAFKGKEPVFTLSQLRQLFFMKFHKAGEVWFDYLSDEKECKQHTEDAFQEFLYNANKLNLDEELKQAKNEVVPAPAWAISIDTKGKIGKLESDRQDAERWRKLIRFVDENTDVKLYMSVRDYPRIAIEDEVYQGEFRGSFNDLIDSIPEFANQRLIDDAEESWNPLEPKA